MSSPSAPAAAAPPRPLGFVSRAIGVFISPSATFEDVARKPTVIAPPPPFAVEIIIGDKREIKNFASE